MRIAAALTICGMVVVLPGLVGAEPRSAPDYATLPPAEEVLKANTFEKNPVATPRLQAAAFLFLQNYIEFTANSNEPSDMPATARAKWKQYRTEKQRLVREHKLDPKFVEREAANPVTFQRNLRSLSSANQDAYHAAMEAWRNEQKESPQPVVAEAIASSPKTARGPAGDRAARRAAFCDSPAGNRAGNYNAQLINSLPARAVPRSVFAPTDIDHIAALWLLMDYVRVATGLPHERALSIPQYKAYCDAQVAIRENNDDGKFIRKYYDPYFMMIVIRALPHEYQAVYWPVRKKTPPPDPEKLDPTTVPPPPSIANRQSDDGRYSKQRALAKSRGVDLTLFGMGLYEPLTLPDCPDESIDEHISGTRYMCRSRAKASGTLAKLFRGEKELPYEIVSIRLPEDRCPDWVYFCSVAALTLDGYLMGMDVPVDLNKYDIIVRQLSKKYGKQSKKSSKWRQCRHPGTGVQTYSGYDRVWPMQGLRVQYAPAGKCYTSGFVMISTPELLELEKKKEEDQLGL